MPTNRTVGSSRWWRRGLLATIGLTWPLTAIARAEPTPQQWAVIVAIQHYEVLKGKDLACTIRDANELRSTLVSRGDVPEANILMMTDRSPDELKPRSAQLRSRMGSFLKQAAAGDRVVVYFSGHGVLVGGRSVLLPADYDPKVPASGLPVGFIHEALRDCRAASKFLILDCCHAGGAKGADDEAGDTFRPEDLRPDKGQNVVVLASCRADQKSLQWFQKDMSFFTYWLCRAFEGGADRNGDGNITFNEVYDYTFDRVRSSVAKSFSQEQDPVRWIDPSVLGDPVLLALKPERPDTLGRRLAEELDVDIRAKKLRRVAVRRFTLPVVKDEELAGSNYTWLIAERVRKSLAELARVEPRYQVGETLIRGFGQDVVSDALRLKERAAAVPGGKLDGLIDGAIKRNIGKLQVSCELILTDGNGSVAQYSSRMPSLRIEDCGDLGLSLDTSSRPALKPEVALVTLLSKDAETRHPLDPTLMSDFAKKFRVEVWKVGGLEPKKAVFRGNAMIIGARKGEVYEVRVWNTSGRRVGVALLIDGVNTWGMRRDEIARARVWSLDPRTDTYYRFDGFHPEPPAVQVQGGDPAVPSRPDAPQRLVFRKFEFSDVAESVAAQPELYADSIGVISVTFFAEAQGGGKGLGTKAGEVFHREMIARGFAVGECLGTINIRYVDEADLDLTASR